MSRTRTEERNRSPISEASANQSIETSGSNSLTSTKDTSPQADNESPRKSWWQLLGSNALLISIILAVTAHSAPVFRDTMGDFDKRRDAQILQEKARSEHQQEHQEKVTRRALKLISACFGSMNDMLGILAAGGAQVNKNLSSVGQSRPAIILTTFDANLQQLSAEGEDIASEFRWAYGGNRGIDKVWLQLYIKTKQTMESFRRQYPNTSDASATATFREQLDELHHLRDELTDRSIKVEEIERHVEEGADNTNRSIPVGDNSNTNAK
jgi:hypothetical protein